VAAHSQAGPAKTHLGVHGATAAVMVAAGALLALS
jgi:hypothetical protein